MKNLPRWIFASLAKHFETVAATNSIPYFVEGVDERDEDNMQGSHVELRVTGPSIKEVANGQYHVEAVLNILVTSNMDMKGSAYEIVQWCGIFQDEMLEPLPIYKLGDGVDDDQSLIGCLRAKGDKRAAVRVFHFGQVHTTDRIRQSEVDGVYEMDTEEVDA
jgi:hypothetical protein